MLQIGRSLQRINKVLLICGCFFRRKIIKYNEDVRAGDPSHGGLIKRANLYYRVLAVSTGLYPTGTETECGLWNYLCLYRRFGCRISGEG